jgi:dynein heavy chain
MNKIEEGKVKEMKEKEKDALKSFLDPSGNQMFLFAIAEKADVVSFKTSPPAPESIKKKALLCLRVRGTQKEEVIIDEHNVTSEVIFMELSRDVLANLYLICHDVYLPVLGNPLNVMDMSELVSKDLMDKFHIFLAHTYVTIGHVNGRTQLPLPPSDVTSSEKSSSKDKGNLLEQAISHWTKQIKSVLKADPESHLKGGQHPDPTVELKFWKNKADNLNYICHQLSSERIKKVLKFLEQNKSTYTGPFSKLQKEVQTARVEANDNYLYL